MPAGNEGFRMLTFPMSPEGKGASGALVKFEGASGGGGGTLVYFTSQDCAVEAERVVSAGGQVFKEKQSIGEHGFIALAIDTESNMIGIHSLK